MNHSDKIQWMVAWATKNKVALDLKGECGFGRECVGVIAKPSGYPEYEWYNEEDWSREDTNGLVWMPEDAYHKHPCVAVLGRGEKAEIQLYEWLKWFDDNEFIVEIGNQSVDPRMGQIAIILGKHKYAHMVHSAKKQTQETI